VTEGGTRVEVDVVRMPAELVMMNVANVGAGEIVGSADALKKLMPTTGLYVLVARSEETICPRKAGTEVLKAYGGVVKVGVARGKFGRVVATVAEAADRNDETSAGDSGTAVELYRG